MADSDGRSLSLALIDLIRGVLWPSVSIIILISFYNPLYDILISLGSNVSSAQTIDLGYLKITAKPPSAARQPEEKVKRALAHLDKKLLPELVGFSDSGIITCYRKKGGDDAPFTIGEYTTTFYKLLETGLFGFKHTDKKLCTEKDDEILTLNETGLQVKLYLRDVLFDQLTFSTK